MKKILAIICSLVVIASSLAGCVGEKAGTDSLNENNQEVSETNTITEEDISSQNGEENLLKE